jgi:FkbM family methyltransferase
MDTPTNLARNLLRRSGFDVVRYPGKLRGPFDDMGTFLAGIESPMILDVGANVGQSVRRFKQRFPGAQINSFEPSPRSYAELMANCSGLPNVKAWNCGMGSAKGQLPLLENAASDMTSFLEPSARAWGSVEKTTLVDVLTLDSFAAEHGIDRIDILKSDTQGFEFDVLSGARRLMAENRISLVYLEMIFSDMYKAMKPIDKVLGLLSENNFLPVNFYEPNFQGGLISWMDALFINSNFYSKVTNRAGPSA